jgi:hypothetical protein
MGAGVVLMVAKSKRTPAGRRKMTETEARFGRVSVGVRKWTRNSEFADRVVS